MESEHPGKAGIRIAVGDKYPIADIKAYISELEAENRRLTADLSEQQAARQRAEQLLSNDEMLERAVLSAIAIDDLRSENESLKAKLEEVKNTQHAVAYAEEISGKIVSVSLEQTRHCTVPLYRRGEEARARTLEEAAEAVERFTLPNLQDLSWGAIRKQAPARAVVRMAAAAIRALKEKPE